MSFEIKPVNRQIQLAACEDPRLAHETGGIDTSEVLGSLAFAVVIAVDETPYIVRPGEFEPPRLAEVGDVVYFDPGSVMTLIAVGCQERLFIHEARIIALVKSPKVAIKDADPRNDSRTPVKKTGKPTILYVPRNSRVN